jgi:hypothetical protein
MKEESHGSRVLYQVVIESSGVLLSIRGVRVTTNKVVLLVVYPSATQARQVLVSGSRSDPSPRGAAFRVKKDTASFKDDLIFLSSFLFHLSSIVKKYVRYSRSSRSNPRRS